MKCGRLLAARLDLLQHEPDLLPVLPADAPVFRSAIQNQQEAQLLEADLVRMDVARGRPAIIAQPALEAMVELKGLAQQGPFWEQRFWLTGVRRVGKTTLIRALPETPT